MASVMCRARRCWAGTRREPVELATLARYRTARGGPRLEKRLLAGDDEPAFTGLQVDGAPLQPGGGQEDSLGVNGERGRIPLAIDREQQDHEDGDTQKGEEPARDHHAGGEGGSGLRWAPRHAHPGRLFPDAVRRSRGSREAATSIWIRPGPRTRQLAARRGRRVGRHRQRRVSLPNPLPLFDHAGRHLA